MPDLSRIYQQRREEDLYRQRLRRQAVFAAHPEIARLDKEYLDLQVQKGLKILEGKDTSALELRLQESRERIVRALLAAGYGENELELQPQCSRCSDTGYVGGELCGCAREALKKQARLRSGLDFSNGAEFAYFDEGIFPGEEQRQRTCALRDRALEYARNFEKSSVPNLLLSGPAGLGKSFLLQCIGKEALRRGFEVRYLTAGDYQGLVMEKVIGARQPGALRPILEAPLLLLDDLGSEAHINNVSEEHMFTLVSHRTAARLPTVFATNQTPSQLQERYGDRTVSRMLDRTLCARYRLDGQDLRICAPKRRNGQE